MAWTGGGGGSRSTKKGGGASTRAVKRGGRPSYAGNRQKQIGRTATVRGVRTSSNATRTIRGTRNKAGRQMTRVEAARQGIFM